MCNENLKISSPMNTLIVKVRNVLSVKTLRRIIYKNQGIGMFYC
jgi:hypothetical protein